LCFSGADSRHSPQPLALLPADTARRRAVRFARRFAALLALVPAIAHSAIAQVPGEIRGRVTSRTDGHGIAGARVDDAGEDASTNTGDDGAFTLRGLTPGVHDLRISAIGFRTAHAAVTAENGRMSTASIVLDALPARLAPVAVRGTADTAGDATTITRAAIAASGQQDITPLLAQVPGVLITRQGGPGAPAVISIRGSNASEVLVIVDGQPINSPLSGEADLSRIPLSDVEQITVIRGAASARYGPGALAGVVLIETRRPPGTDITASATAASWGERDASVSGGFDVPRTGGGIVTVTRNTTQGDFSYVVPPERGGGTAIRDNDDAALTSISASADTRGAVALSMQGSATDDGRGLPGSISAPDCCGRDGDTRVAGGLGAHDDRGLIAWSVALDADHERTRYVDSEPSIGSPYDNRAATTGLIGSATATIGGPAVNVASGIEVRSLSIAATELTAAAPSTERDDGAWAEARAAHTLGAGFTGAADGTLRVEWNSVVQATEASPHLGLSVGRGPFLLSLSGGQSYNPPSLADQYFREGVMVRPNPDLRPERVRDEIEARLTVQEVALGPARLSTEAAVYRADVDGMILWFPNFQFVWSPDNYNVHRSGWDTSTQLTFPKLGLFARATVSAVSADYAGPVLGGQVAYQPRITGSISAGIIRGRVTANLTTLYVGDRRTIQGSSLNSLAPYWITNAQATVRIERAPWPLDALLGIDDVLDERAALLFDYPYPGRTLRLGLRIRHGSTG
jgi:vitamin B12 transporter